ncbi:MAG: sulfatase-like hydrolase/transferase [Verrucomicrobiota bacterium]
MNILQNPLCWALCFGLNLHHTIALHSAEPTQDPLPNIVLFFADDLGFGDLACYGHPYSVTPTLDKLATEGIRLEQHYVTGVTCNPSRTGLMTGRFPATFKKHTAKFGFQDRITISELLKQRGYRTGLFGKWHIGPKNEAVDGTYGLDVVKVMGKSKDPEAGRDDDLTNAAIEFMKETAGKHPFYINIMGHSTHFAVNPPDNLVEKFKHLDIDRSAFSERMQKRIDEVIEVGGDFNSSMQHYLADVYSIDLNVKRVLDAIDELGIRDNTIFVFSSDQGPAPVVYKPKGIRPYSENMIGYAGIFRGEKHTQWEGGVRVPFIIRWPGKVPEGRVDNENVTSFIDWLPTIAAITGIEDLPNGLEGEDVSAVWFGRDHTRTKPLFWNNGGPGGTIALRKKDWKYYSPRNGKVELYDLNYDLAEEKNIARSNPELVSELEAIVQNWRQQLPNYVRP